MSDTRLSLAKQVRAQLETTERSNERALIESARFMASLGEVGLKIGAALEVSQEVMEEAFAGLSAGMESRRRYLAAHQRLVQIAGLIGVDVKATGGSGSKAHDDFLVTADSNVVEFGQAA